MAATRRSPRTYARCGTSSPGMRNASTRTSDGTTPDAAHEIEGAPHREECGGDDSDRVDLGRRRRADRGAPGRSADPDRESFPDLGKQGLRVVEPRQAQRARRRRRRPRTRGRRRSPVPPRPRRRSTRWPSARASSSMAKRPATRSRSAARSHAFRLPPDPIVPRFASEISCRASPRCGRPCRDDSAGSTASRAEPGRGARPRSSRAPGECTGNVRSTPTPCEILRTVNVSRAPPPLRAITRPWNTWMRSFSPSLTFT